MSLFIGNLSARTRRDELERVFRRFGQCELRIKDGYGFVVYSFAPQAEKAMKTLQGRAICGQQLNITWSNKQPNPVQRANQSFKFSSRKFPGKFRNRRVDEEEQREEAEENENRDDPERLDGGGRWGERVGDDHDSLHENGIENDVKNDRYDPYLGSQGTVNDSKFRVNCYSCGEFGHKMRDCPTENSSRRKFKRFDRNNNSNNHHFDRSRRTRNSPEIDRRESKFSKRLVSASTSRSGSKSASRSTSRSVLKSPRNSTSLSLSVSLDRPVQKEPSVDQPIATLGCDSKAISLEEMRVALRHFGAQIPEEEMEKHKSLEEWFGSGRLWPWEGIYYRRVKKGPISVENYAKRVAQNQEFGIVDRFIRSSSGWGEINNQKNP